MTAVQPAPRVREPAGGGRGLARRQAPAREPDLAGYLDRDGVAVYYEAYGVGERTIFLLPTWSIAHSRFWKGQIAYLARHCRVLTFDGRGNGRSDRPGHARDYTTEVFADDALAVMDAVGVRSAWLAALSCGALWATRLAAAHPERVDGICYIGPAVPLAPGHPERAVHDFHAELDTTEGWAKDNVHYWRRHYREYLEFFFRQCFNEPHSTKQIEDTVGWGLDTDPETLILTSAGIATPVEPPFEEVVRQVRCPTMVVHGDRDLIRPLAQGEALARATGGKLVVLEGGGHLPVARDPVVINRLLLDFIGGPRTPARWRRARARTRRALYLSSPIGLGHARRDLAIAAALRERVPGIEIEWLAQSPTTIPLEAAGERIHPAGAELLSEAAHIESEGAGHELPVFDALRRMDEILVANFMLFHDVVSHEPYDVWIADEAWELDYFLHENPELKRAPYVWMTDFVGWLPMAEGGAREAQLTADLNAEMLWQVERFPALRDRSIFIGEPADVVGERFGPGLPSIRDWVRERFAFTGYITGSDAVARGARRAELRDSLGYGVDEPVCVVSVGGSGLGGELLELVAASYPEAAARVPGLRMILVAGPRIDPATLPAIEGVETRAYVPDLDRHLTACDLAVVQGGLATTMELTAAGRPFLYFPLARHFEQNIHVHHRLRRHGSGRRMEFAGCTPSTVAEAIEAEIAREVSPVPVPQDGAERAAAIIAGLL